MQRQHNLLEIVLTLGAGGGFAHLLHGRQQQANENGDDGDDDQQLNQGETTPKQRAHSGSPRI